MLFTIATPNITGFVQNYQKYERKKDFTYNYKEKTGGMNDS
jgi:hypothetical protein